MPKIIDYYCPTCDKKIGRDDVELKDFLFQGERFPNQVAHTVCGKPVESSERELEITNV